MVFEAITVGFIVLMAGLFAVTLGSSVAKIVVTSLFREKGKTATKVTKNRCNVCNGFILENDNANHGICRNCQN